MRILVIENYPDTTLGLVGEALTEADAVVDLRRAHAGDAMPASDDGYDAAVLLGGSQDARDDANHPYMAREIDLALRFAAADKAVLGICLGAQLLARGLGAENILGNPIEFGWHAVRPTEEGAGDPVIGAIGAGAPTFHWHTDTFTLPEGAIHLASSDRTPNQAFRIGRACYGIQFHLEASRALVTEWNEVFADEIIGHTPEWFDRFADEADRLGTAADETGLTLARRWVALV